MENVVPVISTTGKVGDEEFEISLINSEELKVIPSFDCITFSLTGLNWVNDAIQIKNNCVEEVTINGIKIESYIRKIERPGDNYYIEFLKDELGNVIVNQTSGNHASYIPVKNETLTATGIVGDKEFKISYVKTEKLCE